MHKDRGLLFSIFYLLISLFYADAAVASTAPTSILTHDSLQQSRIHGTVTDSNGEPLPGVAVMLQNTQMGVISDIDGRFNIPAKANDILVFSILGFVTQTVAVNHGQDMLIQMEVDVTELVGITVNAGYYKVKEREQTGNIAQLSAKIIEKQPVNNPLSAMQGHLSGVNIVQNTGVPGGGYNVEIRGKNFINGSTEPLYVVDGVPFGSESLASVNVSADINGGNISPLNALNPNDIESIEVLKDADATAIYGARGANGVVLITTKKGREGKTQFKVNMSSTLGRVSHFLDLMNTQQYIEVRREGIINDGYADFLENPAYDYIWPDVKTWDQNRYTDWQKKLIGGTSYRNQLQLSISGGSAQTQFLMSGAYQNETTVFPGNSKYGKVTVHSNLHHQSNDKRFTLNLSTSYSQENNNMPRTDLTGKAYTIEPNAPTLYDENGNLNWENNTWDNPLASLQEEYQVNINTLIANLGFSYSLLPGLDVKTSLGYTTYNLDSYRILPSSARKPSLGFIPEKNSSITTNNGLRQSWIIEPQLHWKNQWNKLGLNVLLGSSFQSQTAEQLVLTGKGFPNNDLIRYLGAANTLLVNQDVNSDYKYHAVFGRVNLNWNGKYIMNITGRRDGSSRFGPGRQFGNFGAIGAAWLFLEETFFKGSSVFSFGKLRGSYGTTGSDNIGDYQFLDSYTVGGSNYNGTTIVEPTGIYNPIFGWEANKKLEIALELGLFKDRILLNTSWYQNRSSNQLIGIPLAATTGFSSLTGNLDAKVENTGLEIDLHTRNIQSGDFQWSTTFTMTLPKNRLVEFPRLETSTFANSYIIGQPLGIIHLYHALGVNPDTGVYEFEDYNGDNRISSSEDRQWIEDFSPKLYGGISNTINYKNFSFDFFFQFKKQKAYNMLGTRSVPGYRSNGPIELLKRWRQIGDSTPIMLATASLNPSYFDAFSNQRRSNAAVSDASFIRLRNISINYKIPEQLKHGVNMNVYLQGQNLLTFTGYEGPDPEQPSSIILPPLRQITLGIQIGF